MYELNKLFGKIMSKIEKLIKKIFNGSCISYAEAEKILLHLNFELDICGSHHVFRQKGYAKAISIKRRAELLPYQAHDLKRILLEHDYEK